MGPAHLDFANAELKLLQQILGLLPSEKVKPNLRDPMFVSIDIEAFEAAQDKITEIGVSVLDTNELSDVAAGPNAANWPMRIKSVHYRPVEHATLLNRRFVKGCEDRFNFGTTAWIKLADVERILKRIFLDPAQVLHAANFDTNIADKGRNIIFVAHGLRGDRKYLNRVGVSLNDMSNIARIIDTQRVAGSPKKSPVGLQRLLLSLGLEPVNLHNAGNDAAYTLQALILMAVRDYEDHGTLFSRIQQMPKKLPPEVYTQEAAPHIWSGTTTKPVDRLLDGSQLDEAYVGSSSKGVKPTASNALPRKRDLEQSQNEEAVKSAKMASCP